jgi:ribonuclease BN (tRNA processing enzyme)
VGADYLMFDCGPATTHKLAKVGLFPTDIDHLFFTHHHYDHNGGYPVFLLCRWDHSVGRENRLQIWGPPPTTWITERLIGPDGAFSHDWKSRVEHPASHRTHQLRGGSLPRREPSFDVADTGPGHVMQHARWSVRAARAQHYEPWLQSLAYRVDSDEGSIAFTGDTAPCTPVIELARGADVLVMSCWDNQARMESEDKENVGVIAGTLDVAKMARECKVKTLVVAHTQPSISGPGAWEKAVGDIAQIYEGRIIFAEELMKLPLIAATRPCT